jgi:hypothetical protein
LKGAAVPDFDDDDMIDMPKDFYADRALAVLALMKEHDRARSDDAKSVLMRAAERLIATMEVKEPAVSKIRAVKSPG